MIFWLQSANLYETYITFNEPPNPQPLPYKHGLSVSKATLFLCNTVFSSIQPFEKQYSRTYNLHHWKPESVAIVWSLGLGV